MKLFLLPVFALFVLIAVFQEKRDQGVLSFDINAYKKKNRIGCGPSWLTPGENAETPDIPLMPGAGKYQWRIGIKNDSARLFFNQGINMYYGFHIIEAMASFKKALKFDETNPMLWWAQALAYGPNINDVVYTFLPEAVAAVRKADSLAQNSSPFERSLIGAMSVRYSPDTAQSRQKLNHDYTLAMEQIYLKDPGNADVAALYSDAMMLEHPWQLWNIDGTSKPWTPRIREVLEKTLAKWPEHPGANHYYVHVMEASPFPEKALPSANRLGKLNPGLSHLVHMPSHIYLRTGYYTKGYSVNEEAVKQYKNYLSIYQDVLNNEGLYRIHNEHMLVNCALLAGRKKYSIDAALALQKSIDTSYLSVPGGMGNSLQYIYMVPTLTMIRFGDWKGLLAAPAIDNSHVYASLLWHFGKGMAFSANNDDTAALGELSIIEGLLKDSSLYEPFLPFSPAIDGAAIAVYLLKGTIALSQKNTEKAILYFSLAVEKEKSMVYNEPRDWLLNPKNYLGSAYAAAGQWNQAEKAYQEDLKDNNENVWALTGLYKIMQKQHKQAEAKKIFARLSKAAAASEVMVQNGF